MSLTPLKTDEHAPVSAHELEERESTREHHTGEHAPETPAWHPEHPGDEPPPTGRFPTGKGTDQDDDDMGPASREPDDDREHQGDMPDGGMPAHEPGNHVLHDLWPDRMETMTPGGEMHQPDMPWW